MFQINFDVNSFEPESDSEDNLTKIHFKTDRQKLITPKIIIEESKDSVKETESVKESESKTTPKSPPRKLK